MAVGIIPARYASQRFPGKPLALLAGIPVVIHVCRIANAVSGIKNVVVATDDDRIFDTVMNAGFEAVMTSSEHQSGTDRICEAAQILNLSENEIIVNIQGDEPLIAVNSIEKALCALENSKADWSTLKYEISYEQALNPNLVKVVCNDKKEALYFSRAVIPYDRDYVSSNVLKAKYYGHAGLYCYRVNTIKNFSKLKVTPLETTEKLEQLRALEYGMKIICAEVPKVAHGIDTPEDLEDAELLIKKIRNL